MLFLLSVHLFGHIKKKPTKNSSSFYYITIMSLITCGKQIVKYSHRSNNIAQVKKATASSHLLLWFFDSLLCWFYTGIIWGKDHVNIWISGIYWPPSRWSFWILTMRKRSASAKCFSFVIKTTLSRDVFEALVFSWCTAWHRLLKYYVTYDMYVIHVQKKTCGFKFSIQFNNSSIHSKWNISLIKET